MSLCFSLGRSQRCKECQGFRFRGQASFFGRLFLCLGRESGLLGVSGISSDVRALLASKDSRAAEALELFTYRIGRELGSLAAALGGVDAVVFTGGVGENAATIRQQVCRDAAWLGLTLDDEANTRGEAKISRPDSRVATWVIPANEELMIALHTERLLSAGGGGVET